MNMTLVLLHCLMFLVGMAIGSFCMMKELNKNGSNNDGGSGNSSILDDFGECDGVDYHFYKYEKGTKEYKESVLLLTHDLYVMRTITGLCHTEKDVLDCAIRYIEGKEGI